MPSEDEAWNSCSTVTPSMGWHQSNLGLAAGLHRWGKAEETHPNQLPAVRSATWQSERPATHSAAQGRRGCAARLQLVAGAPRPSPRARARLARGPMGGQGTGHLQAVGSLISSVHPEPTFLSGSPPCSPLLFPVQFVQCLSPFFDSILPTTHYPHPVRGTHRPPPNDSTRRRRCQMVEPINPTSTRRPDRRYR